MKVIKNLNLFRKKPHLPVAVALGNFDGAHLGHQAIFKVVKEKAKSFRGISGVLTFESHPQHILGQKQGPLVLTSFFHKLFLLEKAGIDSCFLIDFSKEFSEKTADVFVKDILVDGIGAKAVSMGANARFGRGRTGDSELMKKLAKAHSFDFEETHSVEVNGQMISSSLIRGLIHDGKFEDAKQMLGRPYSFYGVVVTGSGRGAKIGFPTANLNPQNEILPPLGVYAVSVNVIGNKISENDLGFDFSREVVCERLPAVMNYGRRPTFQGNEEQPVIEVHLLDFNKDLAGKTLEIEICGKIREEKRFPDGKALANQIEKDILEARNVLSISSLKMDVNDKIKDSQVHSALQFS